VEGLATGEPWFTFTRWEFYKGMLTALGTITVNGQAFPVRLWYPDQFPDVPPWVEPQEPARWSGHQFGKSELCLELRPDNWVSAASGADMLRSAYNLLSYERPDGAAAAVQHAPSAHHLTALQAYGRGIITVFLGSGCAERVKAGTASALNGLQLLTPDKLLPIFVHDEEDRRSQRRVPRSGQLPAGADLPVYVIPGPPPPSPTRQSIAALEGVDGPTSEAILSPNECLIVFSEPGALRAYDIFKDDAPFACEVVVLPDQQKLRSGRAHSAAGKSVALIGAGSVGSKIADSLIRSGISKLIVVDGDVFLPANLERHVLTWRDMGSRKVHALKRHLLEIMPGAEITVIDENLNWQRSARVHSRLMDVIAAADVIVDATGAPGTTLFLGSLADANQRPFVAATVFEGGIGSLIASCIPGRDPPYVIARANFQAWCDAQAVTPPKSGHRPYEALNEDGVPLVADDASVTMTAGHAARVVLDLLDSKPSDRRAAWLLIGYCSGWLFDGHGHTIRLSVGISLEKQTEAQDHETTAWLVSLIEEHARANKAGP